MVDDVLSRHCEVCGTTLTEQEIQSALETHGPFLCTVHASEEVQIEDDVPAEGSTPSEPPPGA